MKKIILIIPFMIMVLMVTAQINIVEIKATGLTCSMCSNAINKQLKTIPEVEKVDIDLNKNLFTVTLKKGNTLLPKIFKDKVENAGFFVGSMVLMLNINEQVISDNSKINDFIFINTKPTTINKLTKVQVLNKGFVTAKEYKKLTKSLAAYPTYFKNEAFLYHLKPV